MDRGIYLFLWLWVEYMAPLWNDVQTQLEGAA